MYSVIVLYPAQHHIPPHRGPRAFYRHRRRNRRSQSIILLTFPSLDGREIRYRVQSFLSLFISDLSIIIKA